MTLARALVFVGAFAVLMPAGAHAAPSSTSAPVVEGTPGWGQTLTCRNGTWSADAVAFEYQWVRSGSNTLLASGQTWKVNDAQGYSIRCQVIARDAAGATTTAQSPAVTIGDGIMEIATAFKKKQNRKKMVVKGSVTPLEAHQDSSGEKTSVTIYRKRGTAFVQLTFQQYVKADGTFRLRFESKKGKHTYLVQVSPANSRYGVAKKTITIRGT